MNLTPLGTNRTELKLTGGLTVLFSYKTPVACKWTNGDVSTFFQTDKKWSRTTSRHVSEWLHSFGNPGAQYKPQDYFDKVVA